ncbi:hypothetical protein NC653_001739 [Populus alba x Populus x berolinensis]|uniref:Uncharacterized protein n=1 Tax=Populus alba x Populus x berolinensis TaxID=444605 RepID=A0AAD6RLV6_9ROSI|nr:hypothetical protein NC653_001739 [Populus alba x Populus x berolinensis]
MHGCIVSSPGERLDATSLSTQGIYGPAAVPKPKSQPLTLIKGNQTSLIKPMVFSASSLNKVPTQEEISRAKQSGGSSYTEDLYDFFDSTCSDRVAKYSS